MCLGFKGKTRQCYYSYIKESYLKRYIISIKEMNI